MDGFRLLLELRKNVRVGVVHDDGLALVRRQQELVEAERPAHENEVFQRRLVTWSVRRKSFRAKDARILRHESLANHQIAPPVCSDGLVPIGKCIKEANLKKERAQRSRKGCSVPRESNKEVCVMDWETQSLATTRGEARTCPFSLQKLCDWIKPMELGFVGRDRYT